MTDRVARAERSRITASIRGRDAGPARRVRSILHALGYRFRLHGDLPGRPDIARRRWRTVIFVRHPKRLAAGLDRRLQSAPTA